MNSFKGEKLSAAQAELVERGVLHDPVAHFPRKDLLTIQFAKCINYWREDTAPEWGGRHESNQNAVQRGYERFLEDAQGHDDSQPKWLRRLRTSVPWGPDNFCLSAEPAAELGYPYEPYLTHHGAILSCHQASRILSIPYIDLVRLKLQLLIDRLVIDEAIRRMLKPRPEWPRIALKPGGKGRAFRLASGDDL